MTCECANGYVGRHCEIHLLDTVDGGRIRPNIDTIDPFVRIPNYISCTILGGPSKYISELWRYKKYFNTKGQWLVRIFFSNFCHFFFIFLKVINFFFFSCNYVFFFFFLLAFSASQLTWLKRLMTSSRDRSLRTSADNISMTHDEPRESLAEHVLTRCLFAECGIENCIIQCPYDEKEEQQPCACKNGTKIYNSKLYIASSFANPARIFPGKMNLPKVFLLSVNNPWKFCRSVEIRVQNQTVERDVPKVRPDCATRQLGVLRR